MLTHDVVLEKTYSKEQSTRLNYAYSKMINGSIEKEQLMKDLDISERTARDILNGVGFIKPVYSLPNDNGKHEFKIATTGDDVVGNERKIYDRLSRVEEMLYSILPNLQFELKNNIDLCLEKEVTNFLNFLNQPKIAKYIMRLDD